MRATSDSCVSFAAQRRKDIFSSNLDNIFDQVSVRPLSLNFDEIWAECFERMYNDLHLQMHTRFIKYMHARVLCFADTRPTSFGKFRDGLVRKGKLNHMQRLGAFVSTNTGTNLGRPWPVRCVLKENLRAERKRHQLHIDRWNRQTANHPFHRTHLLTRNHF